MKKILTFMLLYIPFVVCGQIANNFFWSHTAVSAGLPIVYPYDITDITSSSATAWGEVMSDGGATITERGVCWNTGGNPTTSDSKQTASGTTGVFSCAMGSLSASTLYYVRAYAINSVGTGYSSQFTFTTAASAGYPSVSSNASVTDITETTASFGGNVTSDGGSSVTARGSCWSTSANPTTSDSHTHDGTGTGSFASSVTGLTACQNYYIRAYATNSTGTAYGDQRTFQSGPDDDADYKFIFFDHISTDGGSSYYFTASCNLAYGAYIEWTTPGWSGSKSGYTGYLIHSTPTVGDYFYRGSTSPTCVTNSDGWYVVVADPGGITYYRVHLVSGIITSVSPAGDYCTSE
jgi:hypothetical protein